MAIGEMKSERSLRKVRRVYSSRKKVGHNEDVHYHSPENLSRQLVSFTHVYIHDYRRDILMVTIKRLTMSSSRRPPVLPHSMQLALGINSKKSQRPQKWIKSGSLPDVQSLGTDPSGLSTRRKQITVAEDDDIASLEKKLRLKDGKIPKSLAADGLDALLEGLDSEDESRKRKREGRDWLERKRRRFGTSGPSEDEDPDQATDDVYESSVSGTDSSDHTAEDADDLTSGETSDPQPKKGGRKRPPPSRRENPLCRSDTER